mgnify:CR=1 FL=1
MLGEIVFIKRPRTVKGKRKILALFHLMMHNSRSQNRKRILRMSFWVRSRRRKMELHIKYLPEMLWAEVILQALFFE